MKTAIRRVHARQILDSRGRPTVEVDIELEGGAVGRGAVPSGASTGSSEAHELRDNDPKVYRGSGVSRAVTHANGEIAAALRGMEALDQRLIDSRLVQLDGTPQLSRLGANAVLGVSLAVCRAAAAAKGLPLYRHIAELAGTALLAMPMPMVNILSGGLHAGLAMDVQDILAIAPRADCVAEAIHIVSRVRSAAAEVMAGHGMSTLLADEGGLSPGFTNARDALRLMVEATEKAGLEPGVDMVFAMDVAASSLLDRSRHLYHLAREGRYATSDQMCNMVDSWIREFPIVSIEDPLDEEDWEAWTRLTARLGATLRLIGDDLFTTNLARLSRGVSSGCANGILIKLNQNGTLSGTLEVITAARKAGYATVVSARSGETEDAFISDLAVGTAAGQIKIGSLRSSERLAKYNQLLRIEEDPAVSFAGMSSIVVGST